MYCKCTALPHIRLRSCFSISMVLAYSTSDISKTEKIRTFKGLSVKLICMIVQIEFGISTEKLLTCTYSIILTE